MTVTRGTFRATAMFPYAAFGPVLVPMGILWKALSCPFVAVGRGIGAISIPPLPDTDMTGRVVIVTGANTGKQQSVQRQYNNRQQ